MNRLEKLPRKKCSEPRDTCMYSQTGLSFVYSIPGVLQNNDRLTKIPLGYTLWFGDVNNIFEKRLIQW